MQPDPAAAVVLFSGGQDSTTCLAWALRQYRRVEAVTIDYGQRHRVELECARAIAERCGVPHRILPCDSFTALGGNSLVSEEVVRDGVRQDTGLPNTFVPGRNLIFLCLVAAYAWQRSIANLVTGVCQTDFSGYPDCRQTTMDALQAALRAGMDWPFTIHTPLMFLTKADSVRLAVDLDALPLLALSHTCYNGSRPPCGTCPACLLRAKGFAEAGIADPLTASPIR
ncbi:7-cyano-7-deazaguanine synthase [Planctomycetota bacterium]|nr:7-cyano-7-deazaguanine synthase [Planctomycetota bacterium]